jgi:exonuclease SbcC
LANVEAELEAARVRAGELVSLREQLVAIDRRHTAALALAELAPQHADARTRLSHAVDAHQRSVDEHQRRADARLAGIAAELACGLGAGEPCPVCGSVEHPRRAEPAGDAVGAADVAAAARTRNAAEAQRAEAQADLDAIERAIAAARAVAADAGAAQLAEQHADVERRLAAAAEAAARVPELATAQTELRAERDRIEAEHTRAVAEHATAESRLQAAQRAVGELRARIVAAAGEHASVARRRAALHTEADRLTVLADAVHALADAARTERNAEARAAAEAAQQGFADLDAAVAAALPADEQDRLRQEVEDWDAETARLRAAVLAEQAPGLEPEHLPDVARAAAEASAAAGAAEADLQRATGAAAEAARGVSRYRQRLFEVDAARSELEQRRTQAAPVTYLSRLARGMTGQRRVALTTYVLRRWFEQVVRAANVRLADMSSGRYELHRSDEARGRSERVGLTLQVLDRHTGELRSPRSLSGGETFYTSLALALGLADVVKAEAGGVDLDTLFIDEGFGSLDADTLEQVMGVIDDLRDRGRMVGIVSHVSDLRERIIERVEVRHLPDGSSTLRVVA